MSLISLKKEFKDLSEKAYESFGKQFFFGDKAGIHPLAFHPRSFANIGKTPVILATPRVMA
jgi:hypothetical protein